MDKHHIIYDLHEVVPYINWVYFYYAWQLRDKEAQSRTRKEAEDLLCQWEGIYHTHALFALGNANSDGDDILFEGGHHLPMLRQQTPHKGDPNLCMADFIRPLSQGVPDRMGIFCTTVDGALEHDFLSDEYSRMMAQLLADRLAEATAELVHLQVRREYWGYAPDEHLSIHDLQIEKFQGIRPAIGYPSLPDTSLNFVLDEVLHFADVGIRLTESGAMKPHASVSGLMISHPAARYFMLGKIGDDQLRDYARRRQVPVELMRRFLSSILT